MNPELPRTPREELELRVTALLLGELSATEAASVYATIASNPELTRLHDDLKQTIHLVRQATANASSPTPNQTPPPQLSEERRRVLRTHFAIPPLKPEHRQPKPNRAFQLLQVLSAISLVGVLGAMLLPSLGGAKSKGQRQSEARASRLPATELMFQRDSANRADSPPASPSSDFSFTVATPVTSIPSTPARQQIALPSNADADTGGVFREPGDQIQPPVNGDTPIVAAPSGGIDFDASDAGRAVDGSWRAIAPAPAGLPPNSRPARGAAMAEGTREELQPVFRERYGLGIGAEGGRGMAGGVVATKGLSNLPPPSRRLRSRPPPKSPPRPSPWQWPRRSRPPQARPHRPLRQSLPKRFPIAFPPPLT